MSSVAKIEERILKIGAKSLTYRLERKRIKRINLRIVEGGEIRVSAPTQAPLSMIEGFLDSKLAWIENARHRVMARRGNALTLSDGEQLPIEGFSHTVIGLKSKKQGVLREEGKLVLLLRDPADVDERRRVFERFVRDEAARVLTARVQALYPLFADHVKTVPALSFRAMKSRWGSCTASKGHVSLNTKLLFVPQRLADYVILHELCHFRHQDHSAAFWRHLSSFCPDCAAARAALRAFPIPQL